MSEAQAPAAIRWVRDVHGRNYRVGETDRDLLGHHRSWVMAAAWLAMLAVSATQYGYGVLVPTLVRTDGWGMRAAFWGLAIWVCCHAAALVGLMWLRGRARFASARVVAIGAVMCALGLVTLAHSGGGVVMLLGYGVVGGTGAGLVYGACLASVASWYPDRPARVGLASGAFAYGAIPFIIVAGFATDLTRPLDLTAIGLLVVIAGCATVLRDAPPHWWPAHLDPRQWAVDKSLNPALRSNRPANRRYSPAQLLRCSATRLMYLLVICASAVALFDTGYLAVFAVNSGWGLPWAAGIVAAFAAGSGTVRGVAVRVSQRTGARALAQLALYVCAASQLVLLGAGEHQLLAVFLVAACVAGMSGGVGYALLPGLVDTHFGESPGLPNFAVVYSAKAIGGVVGIGLAGLIVIPNAYPVGLALACALCLVGAVAGRLLRRPGLPALPLPGGVPVRTAR